MKSFDSMKQKIEQTGLYRVTEGSNIEKELAAYAEGLDALFDGLAEMERECFIETAESYGLSNREGFLGYDRSGEATAERRSFLEIAEQLTGECTVEAFNKTLEGYGLKSFGIAEKPANDMMIVYVYDELTDEEKSVLQSRMIADFPLHLVISVSYSAQA